MYTISSKSLWRKVLFYVSLINSPFERNSMNQNNTNISKFDEKTKCFSVVKPYCLMKTLCNQLGFVCDKCHNSVIFHTKR